MCPAAVVLPHLRQSRTNTKFQYSLTQMVTPTKTTTLGTVEMHHLEAHFSVLLSSRKGNTGRAVTLIWKKALQLGQQLKRSSKSNRVVAPAVALLGRRGKLGLRKAKRRAKRGCRQDPTRSAPSTLGLAIATK